MLKKIGLFWLRDDFRIKKNLALIEATKKHEQVVVFYLYKRRKFEYQESQRWWVGKSLEEFQKKLNNYNINLEIIKVDTYESFFKKLFKKNVSWKKRFEKNVFYKTFFYIFRKLFLKRFFYV